jgi:hypothetical protein
MRFRKLVSALLCISVIIGAVPFFSIASFAEDEIFEYAVKYNGNYYKAFDFRMSWDEARQRCEQYGGHLVTINSPEEDNFVYNYLITKGIYGAWIGAENDGSEWHWVTGETFDYRNFADSESPGLETGDEICSIPIYNIQGVRTMYGMYFDDYLDGKWHIYNEETLTYPYICEWESIATGFEYDIRVTDMTTGNVLPGAQVLWENQSFIVPQDGIVSITVNDSNASSVSDFFVYITNENYITRSIPLQSLSKNLTNQIGLNFSLDLIQKGSGGLVIDNTNKFVSGFNLSAISASEIKSVFLNTNLRIIGKNGNELSNGESVVTGTRFRLYNGSTVAKEYVAVIYGDCDCDGKINANDSLIAGLVAQGLLNEVSIGPAVYEACDANADGVVDSLDSDTLFDAGLYLRTVEQIRN